MTIWIVLKMRSAFIGNFLDDLPKDYKLSATKKERGA